MRLTSYRNGWMHIYVYTFLPPTGNCLVGKLHQKLESYCHATICTSMKEFDKAINDVSFMDFHVLSPTTTIIIKDGVIIKSHSNIPSISARYNILSKTCPDIVKLVQNLLKNSNRLTQIWSDLPKLN